MRCRNHASFIHTVFQGTAPTTIKLCDDCAAAVDAEGHLANIKNAGDKEAKQEAVQGFLAATESAASGEPSADQPTA